VHHDLLLTNLTITQLQEGCSEEAQEFVDLCLAKDPRQRPSPAALLPGGEADLENSHPFIANFIHLGPHVNPPTHPPSVTVTMAVCIEVRPSSSPMFIMILAVCCRVLQCVAVCCRVLQCVAVCMCMS